MSERRQTGQVDAARTRTVFSVTGGEPAIRVQLENKTTGHVSAVEWSLQEATRARDVLQETIESVLDESRGSLGQADRGRRGLSRRAAGGGRA